MSTVIPSSPPGNTPRAGVPDDQIWRLTVDQYQEMIRTGILSEDDRVELVEGWLVYKMTKNPPHSVASDLLRDALQRLLPPGWLIRTQVPITLEDSQPEPDIAVIHGNYRDYATRHPGPLEVGLLVEVADTGLRRARGSKKRAYARAGIAVYWIVNLMERQIEVYTEPTGPADEPDYGKHQEYGATDAVPVVIAGTEVGQIAVKDILP